MPFACSIQLLTNKTKQKENKQPLYWPVSELHVHCILLMKNISCELTKLYGFIQSPEEEAIYGSGDHYHEPNHFITKVSPRAAFQCPICQVHCTDNQKFL